MAEITLVLAGKPRKGGELPPLKGMGKEKPEEAPEMEPKPTKESARFWDESNPHVCDTCEHRVDTGCSKVEGVDFDDCDQTLSGCSEWEAAGGEEEAEEVE